MDTVTLEPEQTRGRIPALEMLDMDSDEALREACWEVSRPETARIYRKMEKGQSKLSRTSRHGAGAGGVL